MSQVAIEELDACDHCIVGKVILQTQEVGLAIPVEFMRIGAKNPTTLVQSCYCNNCATVYHSETYLKELAKRRQRVEIGAHKKV